MTPSLTDDEALQAVKDRLPNMKVGDKIVIENIMDGFSVHSEFKEVRSEKIVATATIRR